MENTTEKEDSLPVSALGVRLYKRQLINPKNPPIPMPSPEEVDRLNREMQIRASKRAIERFFIEKNVIKNRKEPNFFQALWNLCAVSIKLTVRYIKSKFLIKR